MKRLAGKVALVTGASRGIGRAIAKRLSEDGALVAINYAGNAEAASSAVAEIQAKGGAAFAVQARLGSAAETAKLLAAVERELAARLGKPRLDILVNNAGSGLFKKLTETSEADFEGIFAANTKTPFLVTNAVLPLMGRGGRIINISSGASRRPGTVLGAYAASKAALDAMSIGYAAELGARGITVNVVAPGWTETEANAGMRANDAVITNVVNQTALGRLGTPEDIAGAVAMLASEDSGWITGQYVEVSGGSRLL